MSAFNPLSSRLFRAIAVSTALFAANCSGKTYSTFLQPFDIVFGNANSNVNVGLAKATPLSPTRVRVEFNKPVNLSTAENTANYVITNPSGVRLDIIAVTRDAFNTSVVYIDTSLHTAGLVYTVTGSNIVGIDGATLSSAASTATYTAPSNTDLTGPSIMSAVTLSQTTMQVTFSEAVMGTVGPQFISFVAADFKYYGTLADCNADTLGTNITSGLRDTLNYSKATLTTAALGAGPFYLRAFNVKDIWGNVVTTSCSLAFAGYTAPPAPKVASAVSQSQTSVLVTFDQAMTNNAALVLNTNYSFSQCASAPTNLTNGTIAVSVLSSTQVLLTSVGNAGVTTGTCKLTVNAVSGIVSASNVALSSSSNVAVFQYATSDNTAPALISATASNATTVRVTFNEPIQTPAVSNFSFSPALSVSAVACNAALTYCDLTTAAQSAQAYTVTATSILDTASNTLTSGTASFAGDAKPYITAVIPIDSTTVRVQWSEAILATPAGTGNADYLVDAVAVTGAALFPAGATSSDVVQFTVPTMTSGQQYTLVYEDQVTLITDASGNNTPNTVGNPRTLTFTGPVITNAPQVNAVVATSPYTIRITFNEPLDNSQLANTDFALSGAAECPANINRDTVVQVQAGVVQLSLTGALSATASATDACTLTVGAGNVYNLYGTANALASNNFTYPGTGAGLDTTAPTILSAIALSSTQIQVLFSENVTTATGQDANNYAFSPTLTKGSISCTGSSCVINVTGQTTTTYTVTASGIADAAGNSASSSATFYGTGGSDAQPTLYLASLINPTTLELQFSEQVDMTTAQTTTNYLLSLAPCDLVSNSSCVTAAVRQADATKVRLTLSPGAFGSGNSYTVEVKTAVTDLAGYTMTTPRTATFTGSANAPSSAPDLIAASDTGSSNTDNNTGYNITFPSPGLVFTGTVAANTNVIIYDNGVIVGSATSNGSGLYSVIATATPAPGQYSLATVSSSGVVSDPSGVLTITFDNAASAAPGTPVLKATSDSGISNIDKTTNATAPVFSVSCVNGESVQLYNGATATGSAVACPVSGTVDLTAGTLTAGNYTQINAIQTDTAGNISAASGNAASMTVDTTASALQSHNLQTGNTYIDLVFDTAVYGSATAIAPVTLAMLNVNYNNNGSGVTINPTLTNTSGGPLAGGETTLRLNLAPSGTASGVETVQVTSVANSIYDIAGNASSFDTGVKTFGAVGVASITGTPVYTAVAPVTGGTTGYIEINWSEGVYTNLGASGAVLASDFTVTFTGNSGNSTNAVVSCVTDTASTSCPGTPAAAGATSMRLQITNTGVSSGVETIRVNVDTNAIFSATSGATPNTVNTGTLTFPDRVAPTVTNVTSSTTDGTYKAGDTVSIQVTFSENVTVTGTPQLTLSTGTPATTPVNFVNVTGGNTLNFTYTVVSGNLSADLDYASTAALSAGTSIRDAANNDANRTLAATGGAGSLAGNKAIVIDAVAPAAPAGLTLDSADDTGTFNNDGVTKNPNNLTFTGTSEANASIKLYYPNTAGTLIGTTTANGSGNWTLDNISLAASTYSIVATATDSAGNVSSASGAYSLTVDTTAPNNEDTVYAASSSRTGGGAVTIVSSGTASNQVWFAPSGTTSFTAGATMTQAASGTATSINAPATVGSYKLFVIDLAGNVSAESTATLTVDNTAPTAAITYSVAGPYKSGAVVTITATFSEPVADSPVPQISISGANTVAATNMTKTSSTVYTYSHTVGAGNGTATVAMATATDLAGNVVTSAPTSGATFTVDNTAPTAAITYSVAGPYKSGASVTITATFSEAVKDTPVPQISISGANTVAATNMTKTSSTVYTYVHTFGAGDGTATVAMATAVDMADNAVTAAPTSGATFTVDNTAPTVSNVTSSSANATYISGNTVSIQVNFSESVTVTNTPQLTLETGTTDAVVNYVSGSPGTSLTFTYTVAAGHNSADLDYVSTGALALNGGTIVDAAGNAATLTLAAPGAANSLGNNKNIVIDALAPTVTNVTASTANGTYGIGQSVSIQVTFSESVTVTNTPQLTLETGTTDAVVNYVSGSPGTTLTFTYTIASGQSSSDLDYASTAALALNGGTINDAAGNAATLTLVTPGTAGSLGANKAIVVDGVVPTVTNVTSSTADGTYTPGQSVVVQVTFSESVTVTGTPQITLETGASDAVVGYTSGSPGTTLSFTYTVVAGHSSADLDYLSTSALALNGGTINDAAGNAATLTLASPGAANSLGANKAIVIASPTGPVIQTAEYYDTDSNGKIDHVKITFDKNIDDSTMEGYNSSGTPANQLHNVTTVWSVAGYSNVRLDTRDAINNVNPADNGTNDTVIWLAFDELGGNSYDTGVKPNLLATDTTLKGTAGAGGCYIMTSATDCSTQTAADVLTASVVETDKAPAIIIGATGVTTSQYLTITFSEPVDASNDGSCSGTLSQLDIQYNDTSAAGVDALDSNAANWSNTNACDDNAVAARLMDGGAGANLDVGSINSDTVNPASGRVYDIAGNVSVTTPTRVVTGAVAPTVLSVTATGARKIRITFSEAVVNAQATVLGNYTLIENPTETGCAGSGADTVALTGTVTAISTAIYELSTDADQCSTTTYRLTASTSITDVNEGLAIATPAFGTFLGNERLKVSSATCLSTTSFKIVFNKAVASGSGSGGAETTTRYKVTGPISLGAFSSATRGTSPNDNEVTIVHAVEQTGSAFTAIGSNAVNGDGFDDVAAGTIQNSDLTESLQQSPRDRAGFSGCGTAIDNFNQGPITSNPFGDGTDAGNVVSYDGKIYIGTNNNGNSVARFNPDGSSPTTAQFEFAKDTTGGSHANTATTRDGGTAVPPYVTLGYSGCTTNNANQNGGCGPDNEDGRGTFAVGTFGSTNYLFVGGSNSGANFDYIYYTSDTDSTLNWNYIDLGTITGTATQGLQSLTVLNNRLYAGMAKQNSGGSNVPDFGKVNFSTGSSEGDCTPGSNCDATGGTNGSRFRIDYMPYFGGDSQDAAAENTGLNYAYIVGVDSVIVFNDRIYAANGGYHQVDHNGSIIRSNSNNPGACTAENTCTDWTEIGPRSNAAWFNSPTNNRFSIQLTKIANIFPYDKAFAQFAIFNNRLYVTRTVCNITNGALSGAQTSAPAGDSGCTDGTDTNRRAQLWKCDPASTGSATDCDAADWSIVGDDSTGVTNMGVSGNRSMTMVVANGTYLYIGYDNGSGIQIWRTNTANPGSASSSWSQIGGNGLGDATNMLNIYSATSVQQGSDYFIYVAAGKSGQPLAVYRQKN